MKTISKLSLLSCLFFSLSLSTSAQQLGIRLGLNVANQSIVDNNDMESEATNDDGQKSQMAFHIGPSFETPITENLYFQTGAIFNVKGHRYTFEYYADTDTSNAAVNRSLYMYLDVPLQVAYKHNVNENLDFFGSLGPSFGISLGGQFIFEEPDGDTDNDFFPVVSDLEDLPEDNYQGVKPLEVSISGMVGIQAKNIQIGIGYMHGLSDINPPFKGEDVFYSTKNRTIQVSFNILIGDKE